MARQIVFTDSGFWKYSWAHLVMSMTESCRWVMQCHLRAEDHGHPTKVFGLVPDTERFLQFFWNFWYDVMHCKKIIFQLFSYVFDVFFLFNDAPNVLYKWKIWTAGRPSQQPDPSSMNPCCNSWSMWFCIVLLHVIWRGAYVTLKALYTFQHS